MKVNSVTAARYASIQTLISDAILRSSLYAHFSESMSGLTTISAYGEKDRFRKENVELVDIENR